MDAAPVTPISSIDGNRAKVAGPANRGITVASTGPTLPPATILGGCSVMGARLAAPRRLPGRLGPGVQVALAPLDRLLLCGHIKVAGQQKVDDGRHDRADDPRDVHAIQLAS